MDISFHGVHEICRVRGRRPLHAQVGLACDDVFLLLAGEVNELHGISGNADGEVGILGLLGMLHGITQLLDAKDIHVEVVGSLGEVAVHHANQGVGTLLVIVAEGIGTDGLCVGDAVKSILIGKLGHRVEGSQESILLGSVGGVGTR